MTFQDIVYKIFSLRTPTLISIIHSSVPRSIFIRPFYFNHHLFLLFTTSSPFIQFRSHPRGPRHDGVSPSILVPADVILRRKNPTFLQARARLLQSDCGDFSGPRRSRHVSSFHPLIILSRPFRTLMYEYLIDLDDHFSLYLLSSLPHTLNMLPRFITLFFFPHSLRIFPLLSIAHILVTQPHRFIFVNYSTMLLSSPVVSTSLS